jgi:hypothetical protein
MLKMKMMRVVVMKIMLRRKVRMRTLEQKSQFPENAVNSMFILS